MSNDEIYAKDDQHPIPDVEVCDIEAEMKNGGADLVIVIASPMQNDQRSRMRLIKKIENYLGYIRSATFTSHYKAATPATTTVTVRYHPGTEMGIQKLLKECHGWVEDNGAKLVLKPI
jgi:predicted RNA binding protein YcfA (HicA-like mRNA interferase family)